MIRSRRHVRQRVGEEGRPEVQKCRVGRAAGRWRRRRDVAALAFDRGACTLVFVIVAFNVFQGVGEVSPVVLAHARMPGASRPQLLRSVYRPSAASWVFASPHTSVGLAFVGAVVGDYLGSARGIGPDPAGRRQLRYRHGVAGIVVLTIFALLLDASVGLVGRRLLRWQPQADRRWITSSHRSASRA